jgi:diaminohydroxyphosphoribosylaminopyrimidine deaminase/5-amino-6-(5-phosphoribosylamino)uracil reductase
VVWRALLRKLAALDVVSVMIEGGGAVAASALQQRIVDKIIFFYAPKILGGDGRAMIDELGVQRIQGAIRIKDHRVTLSGADVLVTGYPTAPPLRRRTH